MAAGNDTTGGAWFVAPRRDELDSTGPGAPGWCVSCGAEVWVGADDHDLARACGAVACPECTHTVPGILYIPPTEMGG